MRKVCQACGEACQDCVRFSLMDNFIYEVRLKKCERAPKCYKLWRWMRYRWDAVILLPIEGKYGGVFDSRTEMSRLCGYTLTRTGAVHQISKGLEDLRQRFES